MRHREKRGTAFGFLRRRFTSFSVIASLIEGDNVGDPLADDLALPLGEGGEHVHLQPRKRPSVGVDVAGDDREADVVSFEELGEPREIGELPRESIDAVDDDAVDVSRFDAPKKLREPGALEGRAALALVVEALGDRVPELPGLASDELRAERPLERAGGDGRVVA